MPDIVRDPVWQFVGAVVTLLAIPVSILIAWWQTKRKSMSYEIITETPVLKQAEGVDDVLQLSFHGKRVRDVWLVVVKLANSGSALIAPSDFERPISLRFGTEASVLTAELAEVRPRGMEPVLTVERDGVYIEPLLMNPRDSIVLKTLLTGFDSVSVIARIGGVRHVKEETDQAWNIALSLAQFGNLTWVLALSFHWIHNEFQHALLFVLMLVSGIVAWAYVVRSVRRWLRNRRF